MRVVLDTNVLLSALISPHGPPDLIYRAWRAGRFEVLTCQVQLDEIRRASRYPKFKAVLQPHRDGRDGQQPATRGGARPLARRHRSADPEDAFLLAMALEGQADFLVTGDHRSGLLQRGHFSRARIVTP